MYRKTSPQQKLFGIETRISPSLRRRLESSWAHLFRCEILPILFRNEDKYAMLYGTTGRPNFSVARLLGLCLLEEWNDLSDQEASIPSASMSGGAMPSMPTRRRIISPAVPSWSSADALRHPIPT